MLLGITDEGRWANRFHRGQVGGRSLAAFARFLGLERPAHLRGNAASRLQFAYSRRGEGWDEYTPTRKGKWTKLLDYNRFDVEEMETLTRTAASELATSERAA